MFEERGKGRFSAYYYSFRPTGVAVVDDILACVAAAGKGAHNTEDWLDYPSEEECYIDLIQRAADNAANAFQSLGDEDSECNQTPAHSRDIQPDEEIL